MCIFRWRWRWLPWPSPQRPSCLLLQAIGWAALIVLTETRLNTLVSQDIGEAMPLQSLQARIARTVLPSNSPVGLLSI